MKNERLQGVVYVGTLNPLQSWQSASFLRPGMTEDSQSRIERLVVHDVESLGRNLIAMPGNHNAFLGISLDKSFFSKKHIKMYFDWALLHCKDFMLIIDDWEEQHNYRVFKGLTAEQAKTKALSCGDDKKRGFAKVLNQYPEDQKARVRIMGSSELFQSPEYAQIWDIREKLISAFLQNCGFRKAVIQQVLANIGTRIANWKTQAGIAEEDAQYRQAMESLPMYLLEEIAVTIYVREQMGFPTEVYPADAMPVVRNLYEGKYFDSPQDYLSRDNYGYINMGIE